MREEAIDSVPSNNANTRYAKIYNWLKWILSVMSIGFFINQLTSVDSRLVGHVREVIFDQNEWMLLVVLLAIVNWNGEAQKIKILLRSELVLSNFRAFLIVLGGMSISNFTPARTGEYIGRGLLLKKVHPLKVVIATVTGNVSQALMTYTIGLFAVFVFLITKQDVFDGDILSLLWAMCIAIVLILFFIFAKRILGWIVGFLPESWAGKINMIKEYDSQVIFKVLGISLVRYLAFSVQFFLLLYVFSDFEIPIWNITLIPVAYLLQSLAPVPAITDVGVRVAVTQLLFGDVITEFAILQAVTCLWFLNLILPGVLGALYLLWSAVIKK